MFYRQPVHTLAAEISSTAASKTYPRIHTGMPLAPLPLTM